MLQYISLLRFCFVLEAKGRLRLAQLLELLLLYRVIGKEQGSGH